MALIRWQPFSEIDTLSRQMDRLFNDLTGWERETVRTWQPAIELQDTAETLILRVEVPGVEGKDLDVRVTREAVVISGEHHYDRKAEEKDIFRSQFRYGKFQRVISLPVAVQNENVKADLTNGILTLALPKLDAAKNRVVKLNLVEPTEPAVAIEAPDEQPANTETGDVWESQTAEPVTV